MLTHITVQTLNHRYAVRNPRTRAITDLGGAIARDMTNSKAVYVVMALLLQSCMATQYGVVVRLRMIEDIRREHNTY